jgi:hypothetical protein
MFRVSAIGAVKAADASAIEMFAHMLKVTSMLL